MYILGYDIKYCGHSQKATALDSEGECMLRHEEEIEFESVEKNRERGQRK